MAGGLAGLASGVDTNSVVDQLMALERQKLTKHSLRQRSVTAEQTGLRDIQTRLRTLRTAADALKGGAFWSDVQGIASSDAAKVEVTRPDGIVPPTSVAVRVDALAKGAQTRYGAWTPPAAETRLWLADGVGVTLKAGATVQDAASAINATGKLVYAGVVDGRLVLTSRETGAASPVPELREGVDFASGSVRAGTSTAGANADVTINGVRDTGRTTNDFWLEQEGIHVRLKAVTATDVTLTASAPAVDKGAIKEKLKAFVDAYNAVVTAVNTRTTEKRVAAPTTGTEAEKGALFGDATLNAVVNVLRKGATGRVDGLDDAGTTAAEPDELLDIGISTGKGTGGASSAEGRLGKLTIDDAKLDAALTDPLAVKAFFAGRGAVEGFSAVVARLTDGFLKADGPLETRIKGADTSLRRIRDQVADAEQRIEAKEKRYKAQFAAMEKAMGLSQSQSAWLSGQIASLNAQR